MDVEKYINVIEFVILAHLKQKNKILFSREIKNRLFQFCQSGIIFDLEQKSDRIKFYVVQKTRIDDIHERLIECRKQGDGWYLTVRKNEWTLENESKGRG